MAPHSTKQQPAPEKSDSPRVWPLVIEYVETGLEAPAWLIQALVSDMRAREEFGRAKYGVSLQVENGRDAGMDAYQEALDLCVYARQQLERTGSRAWARIAGNAVGIAAAIRYQLALEDDARKAGN